MDTLTTHPSTAQQATAFTSPASLSFPGGTATLTPPSEKDGNPQANGVNEQPPNGATAAANGTGVTPEPQGVAGAVGASGIVPALQ